jgi:hypothetical protein
MFVHSFKQKKNEKKAVALNKIANNINQKFLFMIFPISDRKYLFNYFSFYLRGFIVSNCYLELRKKKSHSLENNRLGE